MLVTTNFFDDFCQLETLALCDSARQTAELVMQLLGWKVSMSDDKRLPFAYEFNMLGAVVDLTDSRKGWVKVKNNESRISDIIGGLIKSICSKQLVP